MIANNGNSPVEYVLAGERHSLLAIIVPKWRNWQTRVVQVHVLARVWGFESLLRHQIFLRSNQKQRFRDCHPERSVRSAFSARVFCGSSGRLVEESAVRARRQSASGGTARRMTLWPQFKPPRPAHFVPSPAHTESPARSRRRSARARRENRRDSSCTRLSASPDTATNAPQ